MSYILKPSQEAFEVVDGPHAGKSYQKGVQYDAIPDQEAHKFEPVPQTVARLLDAGIVEAEPDSEPLSPGTGKTAKKRSE